MEVVVWTAISTLIVCYFVNDALKPIKPSSGDYYVDERPMCVVVRKKVNVAIQTYPEVHPKHPDVIAYWEGSEIKEGIKTKYVLEDWKIKKAEDLCRRLNGGF